MDGLRYTIVTAFGAGGGRYEIFERESDGHFDTLCGTPVWTYPASESDEYPYPKAVREKYESLLGRGEFLPDDKDSTASMVEIIADPDECSFDQPCKYGHRVDGHAVYCHNERWLYAPTKCRRTWYTGGDVRDEDCPGFSPNPKKN